jgi:hypothetical protein
MYIHNLSDAKFAGKNSGIRYFFYPNPVKPKRIATKTQTITVYYNLTSCLGVLVAKMFC